MNDGPQTPSPEPTPNERFLGELREEIVDAAHRRLGGRQTDLPGHEVDEYGLAVNPIDGEVEDEARFESESAGDPTLFNALRARQQAWDRYYDELEKLGKDGGTSPELESAEGLAKEMDLVVEERKRAIGLLPPKDE